MIQSVDRAVKLLEAVSNAGPESITLSAVSRQVGLTPSTAYRLLVTLAQHGYVGKEDGSHRYILGATLRNFPVLFSNLNEMRRRSRPYLSRLTHDSGETANLAVRERTGVTFIEQVVSPNVIRAVPRVGVALPLHCTAAGKVFLADVPSPKREQEIAELRLTAFTKSTLTSRVVLEAALRRIRQLGFAVDNEEMEEGGRCVAAPIRNADGRTIAALSLTGPVSRMTNTRIPKLTRLVRQAADALAIEVQKSLSQDAVPPQK